MFVAALPSGTDGWGGERVRGGGEEGCGGRRMRNEEFRRPESPRRSPPPHLFLARVGANVGLSPEEPGLWPAAALAAQPAAPGRAPRPWVAPLRRRGGLGQGRREPPGALGLMGLHPEGRGGGGKPAPELGASSGIVNS